MQAFTVGNCTDATRKLIHSVLQRNVSPNFPSYAQSVKCMQEELQQPHLYPACVNDDYVHNERIGVLGSEILRALTCPNCHEPLTDENGKVRKVGPQIHMYTGTNSQSRSGIESINRKEPLGVNINLTNRRQWSRSALSLSHLILCLIMSHVTHYVSLCLILSHYAASLLRNFTTLA